MLGLGLERPRTTLGPRIIEHVSESGVELLRVGRGEFGQVVPVRPWTSGQLPGRCLRGHDLSLAGVSRSWHTLYQAAEVRCELCLRLRDERASWCLIDPRQQREEPDSNGVVLVVRAPAVRGGVGRITVYMRRHSVGEVDIAACGPCRRACLEQIRVDERFRRLGIGRLLVAAALARLPAEHYSWSTTAVDDSLEARAFWAVVGFPGRLGEPNYCRDMRAAAGADVEW